MLLTCSLSSSLTAHPQNKKSDVQKSHEIQKHISAFEYEYFSPRKKLPFFTLSLLYHRYMLLQVAITTSVTNLFQMFYLCGPVYQCFRSAFQSSSSLVRFATRFFQEFTWAMKKTNGKTYNYGHQKLKISDNQGLKGHCHRLTCSVLLPLSNHWLRGPMTSPEIN